MRRLSLILSLFFATAPLCALDLVKVDGTAFVAGSQRLTLNGEDASDAADAESRLAAAKGRGVNLIHVRLDSLPGSATPGIPSEAGWRQLDRLLVLGGRTGVYILPSLSSFRLGGGAQRLSKGLGGQSEGLYLADGRAREWYLYLLRTAGLRKNSISGVLYKDDPALFGWSLAADLGDKDDPMGERAGNWALRSGQTLKAADPNHLVGVHFALPVPPALGKATPLDWLALPAGAGPAAKTELARPMLLVGEGGGGWTAQAEAKPLRMGKPSIKLTSAHEASIGVRLAEAASVTVDYGLDGWLKDSTPAAGQPSVTAVVKLKGLRAGGRYLVRVRAQAADGRVTASALLAMNIPGEKRLPPRPAPYSGQIIRAENGKFMDGKDPFRYLGTNNYYIRYTDDQAAFDQVLDTARDIGMRVIRCQANGELFEPIKPGIWEPQRWMVHGSPVGFQESSWVRYDKVVAEAGKRGLRVIIYFTDNWEYGGGMHTWARWRGHDDKNAFYTDSKVKADYKNLIKRWLTRKNTITGVNYADDPAVFCWELANEPRYEPDKTSKVMAGWVDEMAGYVKSLDAKHMVSSGIEGFRNVNGEHYSGSDFELAQKSPNIDFATFHFYPVKEFRRFSLRAAKEALRDYVATAHDKLKKPVIMEEYGVEKKYDGDLNRFEWTESLPQTFLRAGGDGVNQWMLVDDKYSGGDGFEFQPQDVDYCNMFSRMAAAVNSGGKP